MDAGGPGKEYVAKVKAGLAEQKDKLAADVSARTTELFVFFSFDLVDSTRYKTLSRNRWLLVTKQFYEIVEDQLRKRLPQVKLWKYVGDELLFFKRLRKLDDLRRILPAAYEVMHKTIGKIYQQFPDAKTILSVKSTVWCAPVSDLKPQDLDSAKQNITAEEYRNISVGKPGATSSEELDFLGPDIDAGFRIAKYALRQRLVVGADLAYLIHKDRANNEGSEQKLRIVAFESLKGVWDSRRYPIVWYEDNWSDVGSSFLYDEHYQNEIVHRVVAGKDGIKELSYLPKVYCDLDKNVQADQLWHLLVEADRSAADAEPTTITPQAFQNTVEVHCAAVCFDGQGRALIAKRPASKRRFPGHWEFGCGQLAMAEGFADCISRNYRQDFGAEVFFPHSDPEPVATYSIRDKDEGRTIPGIVLVAGIRNAEHVRAKHHAEIDWVTPDEAEKLGHNQVVPGFHETLRRAAEAWHRLNQAQSG